MSGVGGDGVGSPNSPTNLGDRSSASEDGGSVSDRNASSFRSRASASRTRSVPTPRFRRHWGISARTRHILGWCDATVGTLRETPVRPEVRRTLQDDAVVRASTATTTLAGGTLSKDEAAALLAGRRRSTSQKHLAAELRNAARAIKMLLGAEQPGPALSPATLLKLHKALGWRLGQHFGGVPGEFRSGEATADGGGEGTTHGGSEGLPRPAASQVPGLVEELCRWLEREFPATPWPTATRPPTIQPPATHASPVAGSSPEGDQSFVEGFVRAVASHLYILWIHPFAAGNGRAARLAESLNLLRAGVPGLACHILPEHYADTRRAYLRQVRRAIEDRSLTSFIAYAAEGFGDGLAQLAQALRRPQMETAWRSFVFQRFAEVEHRKKSVFRRRRALMLAVPLDTTLAPDDLVLLDPDLARAYANLSERTLLRDLDGLVGMGLLAEEDDRFRARTELMVEGGP